MPKTGRPREFNRNEAIFNAMLLFWEQGFESTSLAQLRETMGNISASSFYTTFKSKEALFEEVIKMYMDTFGQVTFCLKDSSLNPKQAIEQALRQSAKMQTEDGHPQGCLLVLSATTCSVENAHIRDMLSKQRKLTRDWLKGCIQNAVEKGQLQKSTDVDMLATVFQSFLLGISTQARDGVKFDTINAAITQIMKVWDFCETD